MMTAQQDAWMQESGAGFTFSNMPTPGPVSRPDRILYTPHTLAHVSSTILTNISQEYREAYMGRILTRRLKKVLKNGACAHDCKPRGRCICGICVYEAEIDCEAPCDQCKASLKYAGLSLCTVVAIPLAMILMFRSSKKRLNVSIVCCAGLIIGVATGAAIMINEFRSVLQVMPEELAPTDHFPIYAVFEPVVKSG